MTRLLLSLAVLFSAAATWAQSAPKTKIVLLGTMHFTPSESDMYRTEELAVSGERRQKEIREVIDKIADFNPARICIEYPADSQHEMDSMYQAFLQGKYQLEDDEIDQLAFRAAKDLDLEKLTCINFLGDFDTEPMMAFAQENDQTAILGEMNAAGEKFLGEINALLAKQTIGEFLRYLNSKEALDRNAAFYSTYFVKVGKDAAYPGTELVADWYRTNLHIFTNVLRAVQPTDRAILVIFGQGHIPILKSLFETNPDFEVVSVEDLLGE